jgi:UrcA family protein
MNTKMIASRGKDLKLAAIASLAALAFAPIVSVKAQGVQEVVVTGTNSSVPGAEARSQSVKFADLDLSKSQGVRTLLTRIRAAATEVCSPEPSATDIPGNKDFRKCMGRAVTGAVETVNSPLLTAMASKRAQ